MDSIKTNNTRRQRGYNFEREIVKRISSCDGWKALRLGSPSVSLPDVIAVNNSESIMLAIEAKSTSTDRIRIPLEQIERCLRWLDTFSLYKHRYAILALKFMSKKWKKAYTYKYRELHEYYKLWDCLTNIGSGSSSNSRIESILCKYDGSMYYIEYSSSKDKSNGTNAIQLELKEFKMPFDL
jgi:Holliday junction resolvase